MSVASLDWRGSGFSGANGHLSLVWGQPRAQGLSLGSLQGKVWARPASLKLKLEARQLKEKQLPLTKSIVSRKSRPVHSRSEARVRGGPSDHSQTSSPCPGLRDITRAPAMGPQTEPPAPQDRPCAWDPGGRLGACTSQTLGHRDSLFSSLPSGRVPSGQTLLWFSQGEALERTVNLASENWEGKQRP